MVDVAKTHGEELAKASDLQFNFTVTLAVTAAIIFSACLIFTYIVKNGNAEAFSSQTYNYDAYPTRGDILELLSGQTRGLENSQDIKFNKMVSLQREIITNQNQIMQTQTDQSTYLEKACDGLNTILSQLLQAVS